MNIINRILKASFVRNLLLSYAKHSYSDEKRKRILQLYGLRIGNGSVIKKGIIIPNPQNVVIGEDCWINTNCNFHAYETTITLGDRVIFAPEVMLMCSSHEIGDENRRAGKSDFKPISIGDGTWIGTRTTILGGNNIGKGCVVGAMTLVNKSIKDNCVAVGVPAKEIKEL